MSRPLINIFGAARGFLVILKYTSFISESPLEVSVNIHTFPPFLTYETEFVLFFSSAGKFCLAHGLGDR